MEACGIIVALLALAAVVLAAHYLAQLRDTVREMAEVQKRLAKKLGC